MSGWYRFAEYQIISSRLVVMIRLMNLYAIVSVTTFPYPMRQFDATQESYPPLTAYHIDPRFRNLATPCNAKVDVSCPYVQMQNVVSKDCKDHNVLYSLFQAILRCRFCARCGLTGFRMYAFSSPAPPPPPG